MSDKSRRRSRYSGIAFPSTAKEALVWPTYFVPLEMGVVITLVYTVHAPKSEIDDRQAVERANDARAQYYLNDPAAQLGATRMSTDSR